jgi:hypothetical protein
MCLELLQTLSYYQGVGCRQYSKNRRSSSIMLYPRTSEKEIWQEISEIYLCSLCAMFKWTLSSRQIEHSEWRLMILFAWCLNPVIQFSVKLALWIVESKEQFSVVFIASPWTKLLFSNLDTLVSSSVDHALHALWSLWCWVLTCWRCWSLITHIPLCL